MPQLNAKNVVSCCLVAVVLEAVWNPTYVEAATAHDPRFEDRAIWPKLSGKEYFLEQQWSEGRLLVWAHPGKGGGKRVRNGLDVTKPANWLCEGKPCEELILDENTDLLFPASQAPYSVGFRGTDIREICRHVTIESGAGFIGGGDGVGRSIYGNVWVKKGGGMDSQGATRFLGSQHTFFRNDNTRETIESMGRGDGIMSSQYFTFNKKNNASVEFLGHVTVLDEFRIFGCTVIVGPDSILQPGRNASPTIQQGGVLALMDGAVFESWNNDFGSPEMQVLGGTIQGGLPDRPLTRDCKFGLAFKNHTKADHANADQKTRSRRLRRVPALVVKEGALKSYTTDCEKAHLVFSVMANQDICPRPGTEDYEKAVKRSPEKAPLYKWMLQLPRGTDCFIGSGVTIDCVEFDFLRRGGLMCEDPEAVHKYKNLFFGPHCRGESSELISHLPSLGRRGDY